MIPEVYLTRKSPVLLSIDGAHAFKLSEQNAPTSDGTPESVHEIIDFLDVENSPRYKRTRSSTYCNIYAHDFATLMGAYLPRVWWNEPVIKKGIFDRVKYNETIHELSANKLYEWFEEYSADFGWSEIKTVTEAVKLSDQGRCVIIVAAKKKKSSSGHITVGVPQTDEHKAMGARGTYIWPLQSQAGAVNRKQFTNKWWSSKYEPVKMYVSNHIQVKA